jgi:hypothetical protein
VVCQLLGSSRRRTPREVAGRADHSIADIGADANGHHVSRDCFAEPHAGIELALDDVGEAVVDNELHADVRVVAQERLQSRAETILMASSGHTMRMWPEGLSRSALSALISAAMLSK